MRIFLMMFSTMMLALPALAQPISNYNSPPGTAAANVVKNVDGSFTIIQPTIWSEGMQFALSPDSQVTLICGLFGFTGKASLKPARTRQQNSYPVVKAVLEKGALRFDDAQREMMIFAVTCNQ